MTGTTAPLMGTVAAAEVVLVNDAGLHARASVRLSQLARSFASDVAVALSEEGPWSDAKSPLKLLRLKALRGTALHLRCAGSDAVVAREAILTLLRDGFGETVPAASRG